MGVLELAGIAAGQWGMITAAQAKTAGQGRQTLSRLADRGALERLSHGIYRIAGTPPGPLDELRAAWLALDPARTVAERLRQPTAAVVSHRSAANLHGLGDIDADQHEFTLPIRKQSRRPDVRIHRGTLETGDYRIIDGLPVTGLVRTIQDLAASRLDGGHLAGVIRDALTGQHVDLDAVADALRPYAHHYGAPLGNGEALVAQFLQEAGVPETTRKVAALASPLREQAAAIAEAMQPMLDRLEATAGMFQQAAAMAEAMRPAVESASLLFPETRTAVSEAARLAAIEGGDYTE